MILFTCKKYDFLIEKTLPSFPAYFAPRRKRNSQRTAERRERLSTQLRKKAPRRKRNRVILPTTQNHVNSGNSSLLYLGSFFFVRNRDDPGISSPWRFNTLLGTANILMWGIFIAVNSPLMGLRNYGDALDFCIFLIVCRLPFYERGLNSISYRDAGALVGFRMLLNIDLDFSNV